MGNAAALELLLSDKNHLTACFCLPPLQYMGCIEVLKSMRSLDFNTRTQVTRYAVVQQNGAVSHQYIESFKQIGKSIKLLLEQKVIG